MKLIKIAVATLCLSFSLQALAAVELKNETFREVEVKDALGNVSKKLEPLDRAAPGQEVVYILSYHNAGKQPATNVVLNNPVAKEMAYVAGSAQGSGARAEVSVDGGKKFGALESLRIRKADGSYRPATGSDVTHVRWTVTEAVKPGAQGSVTYRAVLR